MALLPGGAESACFSHRHKPQGDNSESQHRAHPGRRQDKACDMELWRDLFYTKGAMYCARIRHTALTETHDTGSVRPSKTFVTGDIAPKDDPWPS